ncbi:MAG: low temperature requirement protein A [Nakamurella sp.]
MNQQIDRGHRRRRMLGRGTDESHRAATPLELLFDLTFVVAFSFAGSAMAHEVAAGRIGVALMGFAFSMFSICWAWINFTWFASAFDTDDWLFRLMTMVQMVGVLILALGIDPLFASLEHGGHIDNIVVVLGYVVMRVALVGQWLRVAVQAPEYRATALSYARWILAAQLGWVLLLFLPLNVAVFSLVTLALVGVELSGPARSERAKPTLWHAHHIAERYSLLAIITLGEVILGTTEALRAVVATGGWTWQVAAVGLAGVGLCFGLWWTYFMVPSADVLERLRGGGALLWGYGHIVVFAAIAATGAGLHVAALFLQTHAVAPVAGADASAEHGICQSVAVLAVAIPVAVYFVVIFLLLSYLVRAVERFYVLLMTGTVAVIVLAVALGAAHVPFVVSLLLLAAAPLVTVVGYEIEGHRRHERFFATL